MNGSILWKLIQEGTSLRKYGGVLSFLLLCGLALMPTRALRRARVNATPAPPTSVRVQELYAKLPLSFERNDGQTDDRVRFLSRGPGYRMFFGGDGAVLYLDKSETRRTPKAEPSRIPTPRASQIVRLKLLGANSSVSGEDELAGKVNYFLGNDPTKWRTNVPLYRKVQYQGVYPGIDLVYYGEQGQLEFDFVVAPGADPKAINLKIEGARRLGVDGEGNLVAELKGDEIRFRRPTIYQLAGYQPVGYRLEGLQPVSLRPPDDHGQPAKAILEGGYVLKGRNVVGFRLAPFDTSRPLIIDPTLSYSTFLGGNNLDQGLGIAVDGNFAAYVTGMTQSTNFPTLGGVPPNVLQGPSDAFVTKFNPDGSLAYSTYLGGSGADAGAAIAVESGTMPSVYVTGQTTSLNFPTTANAFSATPPSGTTTNAFLTKLSAAGSALFYSTYLGGAAGDQAGLGVAVDNSSPPNGLAYVTGQTTSGAFPIMSAFQGTFGGGSCGSPLTPCPDAFVTKIDTTKSGASSLVYSTYLGGSGADTGFGIAADSAGNAYITGSTNSTAPSPFPTRGAVQGALGGGTDAFVARIDTTRSGDPSLIFSTYLGGANNDSGNAIAVGSSNVVYVTGQTSTPFPTTTGALRVTPAGGTDAFVSKIDTSKTGAASLVYSTYLGGEKNDAGNGIAADAAGNAYVTGSTVSHGFPTVSPLAGLASFQGASDAFSNAFVAKLNSAGSALIFSTYLGGTGSDLGLGIAVDTSGVAYVTGSTASTNFPTANPFQSMYRGGTDAFVSKITGLALPVPVFSPNSLAFGNLAVGAASSPQTVTLANSGDAPLTINDPGITITGPNSDDFAISSGNCLASGGSLGIGANCAISVTFTPSAAGTRTATVSVPDNAAGSPQAVPLSGTGTAAPSFSLTATPTTATVTAANSQTFTITVTPSGGFNQTITLSCTDPAPASNCTIDNTSISPSGSPVTATATVTTTKRTIAAPRSGLRLPPGGRFVGLPWFVGLLTLIVLGVGSRSVTKGRRRAWVGLAFAMLCVLLWAACGGSGNTSTTGGGTTAGDYTLTFTGTGASQTHTATVTLTVQ